MQGNGVFSSRKSNFPVEWPIKAMAEVASINSESLPASTPKDLRFRYIDISSVVEGRINWHEVTEQEFASSPSRARRILRPGDVMLCTVRPGLKSHASAGWSEKDGFVCSTGFAVLRAGPALDSRFLLHLLFSDVAARQLHSLEMGTGYPAVNESDVGRVRIPCPHEQRAIARI